MESVNKIEYRRLAKEDLTPGLLDNFERHQEVTRVWRDVDGILTLIDNPFCEEWQDAEKAELLHRCFPETISGGGAVFAAFYKGNLIAFATLPLPLFGSRGQYIQLSNLHVSFEFREMGIGRKMFGICVEEARRLSAQKLYISAHSAEETQAFYRAMGCVPAEEKNARLTGLEPCDIQLEYDLNRQ